MHDFLVGVELLSKLTDFFLVINFITLNFVMNLLDTRPPLTLNTTFNSKRLYHTYRMKEKCNDVFNNFASGESR